MQNGGGRVRNHFEVTCKELDHGQRFHSWAPSMMTRRSVIQICYIQILESTAPIRLEQSNTPFVPITSGAKSVVVRGVRGQVHDTGLGRAVEERRKKLRETLAVASETTASEKAAFETAAFEAAAIEAAAFETTAFETAAFETTASETPASETVASETVASEMAAGNRTGSGDSDIRGPAGLVGEEDPYGHGPRLHRPLREEDRTAQEHGLDRA
jgi:hypothetical protein